MNDIIGIALNDPATIFGLVIILPLAAIPVMDYLANKARAISQRRQWRSDMKTGKLNRLNRAQHDRAVHGTATDIYLRHARHAGRAIVARALLRARANHDRAIVLIARGHRAG